MSCFIVDLQTYANVTRFFQDPDYSHYLQRVAGLDVPASAFFRDLYTFNVMAWNQRYREDEPLTAPITLVGKQIDVTQALKSLQCIRYQCIDSDKYREHFIAGMVDELIDDLSREVIEATPQYKTASWG